MSLILEALKKLDREKQTPERGFLVMAAAPWPSASRRGTPALVLGLLAAMGAGAGVAYWILRPAPTTPAASAGTATNDSTGVFATAPPATPAAVTAEAPLSIETAVPTPFPAPTRVPARADARPQSTSPGLPRPAAKVPASTPALAAAEPERAPSAPPTPRAPIASPAVPPLAPPFTLEAISLRDGVPIAVINGRLLHEGDVANGITVVKIGAESVELEIRGVRQVVRF